MTQKTRWYICGTRGVGDKNDFHDGGVEISNPFKGIRPPPFSFVEAGEKKSPKFYISVLKASINV